MNILKLAQRGAAIESREPSLFGGGLYTGRRTQWLPGTAFDYRTEAGDTWLNSVVMPGLVWKANAVAEPEMVVEVWSDSEKKYVPDHSPASADLKRALINPNSEDDARGLWAGIGLSEDVSGSGYWFRRRGNRDQVIGFRWVSHVLLEPMHDAARQAYPGQVVTHYRYTPFGGSTTDRLTPYDIVRVRHVLEDPRNPLQRLSPLDAVLREICSDNEYATMMAALARNMGMPGAFLVPKVDAPAPTEAQKSALRDFVRKFVRDRRGEIDSLPMPFDIVKPGWSPRDMQVAELRADPTARICVAMGFDPMVLGFPSANKTYSNYEEAADAAGKRTIIPTLRRWSSQVGAQILPDFNLDPARYRLWWDFSAVHWMLDDTANLHEMAREDYRAGVIDRATALAMMKLPSAPSDVGVYYSVSGPQLPPATESKVFDMAARTRRQADLLRAAGL